MTTRKKPTTSSEITLTKVTDTVKSDTRLIPEASDHLACAVANLENCVGDLDENLSSVINKERTDLEQSPPRENLCDLASDITVLADRVHYVVQRVKNIIGYLEL